MLVSLGYRTSLGVAGDDVLACEHFAYTVNVLEDVSISSLFVWYSKDGR